MAEFDVSRILEASKCMLITNLLAEANEKRNMKPVTTGRKNRLASGDGVDVWTREYLASARAAADQKEK
jgi:hypothetical protein